MSAAPDIDDDGAVIAAVMTAYSLTGFPFEVRELNPLTIADDRKLVAPVRGWVEAEAIEKFVAARAVQMQPVIVIVAGGSGTGRTSLANCLIDAWTKARDDAPGVNYDPAKLVLSVDRMDDYAEGEQWRNLILPLWPKVLMKQMKPEVGAKEGFDALRAKTGELGSTVQLALMNLTIDMRTNGGGALALVMEDVKKQELIKLAMESFAFADALLIMTVESTAGKFDAVLSDLAKVIDQSYMRMVELDDLECAEVKRVVKHRWAQCSNERLPFDESGLDAVFRGKRRPLVRVVAIMEALLVDKVDARNVERWPNNPDLEYDADTLKQRVSFWDSRVRRKAKFVPGP